MEKLFNDLKIDRTNHIYWINSNEHIIKRLIKNLKIKKRNILAFKHNNRMNIDLFFYTDFYINSEYKDFDNFIQCKNHLRDTNPILNMFFPGYSFCKYLNEELKLDSSIYVHHSNDYGAFFYDSKKSKFYYCKMDDYNIIKKLDFQLDLFYHTEYKKEQINKLKDIVRQNENNLLNLLS